MRTDLAQRKAGLFELPWRLSPRIQIISTRIAEARIDLIYFEFRSIRPKLPPLHMALALYPSASMKGDVFTAKGRETKMATRAIPAFLIIYLLSGKN